MKICCQHFLFIKEFNQKKNICPKIFWWENFLSNKNSTLKNTLVQIYEFVRKIVFEILVRKFSTKIYENLSPNKYFGSKRFD